MSEERFQEHLKELENQHYASTRVMHPKHDEIGLNGAKVMCSFFGAEQDLRSKPRGDNGIDLQLLIQAIHQILPADVDPFPFTECVDGLGKNRHWWVTLDAKASDNAGHLLVPEGEVKPYTIYVLVYLNMQKRTGKCLGWAWGFELLQGEIMDYGWGPSHALKGTRPPLHEMYQLKNRMLAWRHEERDDRAA